MSDEQQGSDWWLASDGKWYPPQSNYRPSPTSVEQSAKLNGMAGLFTASLYKDWAFLLGATFTGLAIFRQGRDYGPAREFSAESFGALAFDSIIGSAIAFVMFGLIPALIRRKVRVGSFQTRMGQSASVPVLIASVLAVAAFGATIGVLVGPT